MNLSKKLMVAVVFALASVSSAALASITNPELGKEYRLLGQPQSTDAGDKVEFIEFFAYWCPHCNTFDPYLSDWVKKNAAAISFRREHISFYDNQLPMQQFFYTLEAMGNEEQLHKNIFKAIHVDHKILRTNEDYLQLVTGWGVDPKKYTDTYRSFSVAAKVAGVKRLQAAYDINTIGVPTVIIDGRYVASPGFLRDLNPSMDDAEASRNLLPVLDFLLKKVQKEKKELSAKK